MSKITIDRAVVEQAMKAMLNFPGDISDEMFESIRALRAALAEPVQEPVAYTTGHCENHKQKGGCQLHNLQCGWPDCDRKPTTAPPQRRPLTEEEIGRFCDEVYWSPRQLVRAVERAHGIKE